MALNETLKDPLSCYSSPWLSATNVLTIHSILVETFHFKMQILKIQKCGAQMITKVVCIHLLETILAVCTVYFSDVIDLCAFPRPAAQLKDLKQLTSVSHKCTKYIFKQLKAHLIYTFILLYSFL